MAEIEGNRKGTLHLSSSFVVLYLMLLQVEVIRCWPEGPLLSRALRSISSPHYGTTGPLQPNVPVFVPKSPYLGTLSEHLKIGSVIRIRGYVPADVTEFQFNLCTDCSAGPIHLHIGVRFHQHVVVRNSYEGGQWKSEERYGGVPFGLNEEFIALIEVRAVDYRITVNGNEVWTFRHRVPYSTVEKFEVKGEPISMWKIEYTDVAHLQKPQQEPDSHQVNGIITEGMTVHVAQNPSAMFEKLTMDLRCECTPQNSLQ